MQGGPVLLKFHRFSGCPVCQDQASGYTQRADELRDTGIETLVVIHSPAEKMLPLYSDGPGLTFIPDPEKKLYRLYGSRFSFRSMWRLGTWKHTLKAISHGFLPRFNRFQGGVMGVPSDFMIAPDGKLAEVHYGRDYGDSWTVNEALMHAATVRGRTIGTV